MAKTEISDYDENDAGNTDISGIGLSNATLIDQLDDIARAQMGALKRWFKSSLFRLRDSTDPTKQLAFNLSGFTSGQIRTVTFFDGDGVVMFTDTPVSNDQSLAGSVVGSPTLGKFTTFFASTAAISINDSAPSLAQGDTIITVSHAPRSTTNKLRVTALLPCTSNAPSAVVAYLQVTGQSAGVATIIQSIPASGQVYFIGLSHEYTPGSTSAQSISLKIGPGNAGTMIVNGGDSGRLYGGTMSCTLLVEEIKA